MSRPQLSLKSNESGPPPVLIGTESAAPRSEPLADQDLPINKAGKWDLEAALIRVRARLVAGDCTMRAGWLYIDESRPAFQADGRLLIADLDRRGHLVVSPVAIFKAAAVLAGARGGIALPESAERSARERLDRFYFRMNLGSPSSTLTAEEYDALSANEAEARLREVGLSRNLAKRFASVRHPERLRGPTAKDFGKLLAAFGEIARTAGDDSRTGQ